MGHAVWYMMVMMVRLYHGGGSDMAHVSIDGNVNGYMVIVSTI